MKSYGGVLTGFLCLSLATLPQALLLLVKSTCGQAHSLGSHILYHRTGENKECAVSQGHILQPKESKGFASCSPSWSRAFLYNSPICSSCLLVWDVWLSSPMCLAGGGFSQRWRWLPHQPILCTTPQSALMIWLWEGREGIYTHSVL